MKRAGPHCERLVASAFSRSGRVSSGEATLEKIAGITVVILGTQPTSYWPLDDLVGSWCHDELGLHDASVPAEGVSLAVIPFGESQAPHSDGELGNYLTIDSDPKYSHAYANALTVAAWICPLALDNA